MGYASLVRPSHREVSKRLSGLGPERPLPLSYSDALGHEPVGDLKRERSAEHKSRCVALYCIFKGYCDELPSCRGQTSNSILVYLVVGVVWMCVGDEIVFGFGVAKHRECDDVSSKNTVKKAEMCRPCSLPLRSTCPVSVCLCDTEHLGRGAVVGLMLGTIRPVI